MGIKGPDESYCTSPMKQESTSGQHEEIESAGRDSKNDHGAQFDFLSGNSD